MTPVSRILGISGDIPGISGDIPRVRLEFIAIPGRG
jgi:hypothetical protein